MALNKLLYSAGATIAVYATWKLLRWLLRPSFSPLRLLPGPASPSWIYGNFKQIFKEDPLVLHERWLEEYGSTYKYKGFLSRDRLCTFDTRALNHILTHSVDYQKPEMARHQLGRVLGEGVLVAEGETHRKQRRIMNPGFGPTQVRELTGIFLAKASQLRDAWFLETQKAENPEQGACIDALSWLSRATLDIIGLAGFNYQFESLDDTVKKNELNEAFATMFRAGEDFSIFPLMQYLIPPLRLIPTERSRNIEFAQKTMRRIGGGLIAEKKAAVRAEKDRGHVAKGDLGDRDLLSLLVRANMAVDVPENQRLSDEDMLAQIPTFMVAGHETTSTGTTWALFALTQRPDVQRKLREELLAFPTDTPTMDQLQALPYLDAVVRETMRVHAPVPNTIRVAMKDDIIPLNEPFVDRTGVTRTDIRINKGDTVFIPILGINRAKSIWGEDAHEFKPERWLPGMPDAVSNIPGVWGNLLTFLGGPHACIGYRFSIIEMKALLFVLIRAFDFELAVPAADIRKKSSVVTRPTVISEGEKSNRLPLFVKTHQA